MTQRETFTKEEKGILVFSSTCHFLSHMLILVFPAVTMPLVASFGMSLEEVVKISFFMYLFYGLCALPIGYIVDRWEARKMLIFGLVGMGLGLVAAGFARTPRSMALSLIMVGIGASVYHPAGLALISHTIQKRGRALAINGVFGNLGIASAPLFTGVLTWLFSWRWALVILGSASIAAAAVLSPLGMNEKLRREDSKTNSSAEQRLRYFVILCFTLVLGGIAYRGNMVLLPAYLEIKSTFFHDLIGSLSFIPLQGTKTLAATILTSLILLTGIFGQLLGGKIADRYDLRFGYLMVHSLSLPFLLAMAFTSNYLLALCAAGYAFFNFGSQPLENSLIAALTPSRWRSTGFAVKFILNFGIGSSVVYLIGVVKRAYSLETVYVFLAGVAFLLVSSILVLIAASRKTGPLKN
jgi:MFS family permease